jgi:hypothetical protein
MLAESGCRGLKIRDNLGGGGRCGVSALVGTVAG